MQVSFQRCSSCASVHLIRKNHLIIVSKRLKRSKWRKDPPPRTSNISYHKDIHRVGSESEYLQTFDKHKQPWTQIDHKLGDYKAINSLPAIKQEKGESVLASSPDMNSFEKNQELFAEYAQPQVIPRTNGVKTIYKYHNQISKYFNSEECKRNPQLLQDIQEISSPVEIISEDDAYIFVYKPSGIACHGTEEYQSSAIKNSNKKQSKKKIAKQKTFYELFCEYWWTNYPFFRFQPSLLHRLDKECSGIMVFGKRHCAEQHFRNLLHGNGDYIHGCGVKKCYIAVCKGVPSRKEGVIEGMIRKCHSNYKRFAIYPHRGKNRVSDAVNNESNIDISVFGGGKETGGDYCRTEFKVIDSSAHGNIGVCSLIIFTITTGKRHQIRASASALGTPIIGDITYGGPEYNMVLLHSLFVGFEGVIDTDLLYAVSCMPKWQHLKNHFWSTKAQYYTQQYLDILMKNPRPSKKYSLLFLY